MKTLFSFVLLLTSVTFCSPNHHGRTGGPKADYFVGGGVSWKSVAGDLNGTRQLRGNSDVGVETMFVPEVRSRIFPSLDLGALIGNSSVRLGFEFLSPELQWEEKGFDSRVQGQWFLGFFEYRYAFDLGKILRPRLGLGYGFGRLEVPSAVSRRGRERPAALFSGTGPHLMTGVECHLGSYVILALDLVYRRILFSNLSVENSGLQKLADKLDNDSIGLVFSVWFRPGLN